MHLQSQINSKKIKVVVVNLHQVSILSRCCWARFFFAHVFHSNFFRVFLFQPQVKAPDQSSHVKSTKEGTYFLNVVDFDLLLLLDDLDLFLSDSFTGFGDERNYFISFLAER